MCFCKCDICGFEVKNSKGTSHFYLKHNLTSKQYYDKYIRKEGEGLCIQCGKETKFLNWKYQKFCSLKCSNNNETRKLTFSASYKLNDISLIKVKREETNLIRHGNKNANRVFKIKLKAKNTCLKKYGVDNPMKLKKISSKSFLCRKSPVPKTSFKWKNYKLPSGLIIKVQGRENLLLNKLLKSFNEKDLRIHKNVPTITYLDTNGKMRRYFPDVYVPRLNWIFEAKCNYTWNPNEETRKNNILKFKEVKKLGFKYNVVIL
jgi:hypothetical protein